MADIFRPETEAQLAEILTWASHRKARLEILGQGSKRTLGRPVEADHVVDMSAFSGIVDYAPNELVITARAATPLSEIRDALSASGQHLAFEPIDHHLLLGGLEDAPAEGAGTLGGMVGCNLSGPRRISVGAARDHLLGVKGVGGTGVPFKAGGRVVKNVTGFDLSKLLCGSWGTLAALTEVSFKVLPRPEKTRTVLLHGMDDGRAVEALGEALRSPHEVSGAVHLPAAMARLSGVDLVAGAATSVTAIRVEGPGPSVDWRCAALRKELDGFGPTEELHSERSRVFWEEVRCVAFLAEPHDRAIWRLSVPPSAGAGVVERVRHSVPCDAFYDWGGGLIWLAIDAREDGAEEVVRGAVAHVASSGHATLVRAEEALRARLAVFPPQADGLLALSRRVKMNLDPAGVLNPGRMVAGL